MDMLIGWLMLNWVSVLTIAVFLVFCGLLWKRGYKNKVYMIVLEIVNEVEEKYGKENEEIKYEVILGKVYPVLPKPVQWLFSKAEIDDMLTKYIDNIQDFLMNQSK